MDELTTYNEAGARAAGYITMEEAEAKGLGDRSNLYRKVKARKVPGCIVVKKSRPGFWVLESAIQKPGKDRKPTGYAQLVKDWLAALENGSSNGGAPCSREHVAMMAWALKKYWKLLDRPPNLPDLNIGNFRQVMGSFGYNEAKRQDFYATKKKIKAALLGFMQHLQIKGLLSEVEPLKIKEYKLKRRYHLLKRALYEQEFIDLIKCNRQWRRGRSDYDLVATDLLIHLFGYGGLRRGEAVTLRRENILWNEFSLVVYGKNRKEREVVPHPNLWPALEDWDAHFEKKFGHVPKSGLLILNEDGDPLTPKAINDKFRRLRAEFQKIYPGKKLSPHPLRHTFATIMSNLDMPLTQLQAVMGHNDQSTTQGYIGTTTRHAKEFMSKLRASGLENGVKKIQEIDEDAVLESIIAGH